MLPKYRTRPRRSLTASRCPSDCLQFGVSSELVDPVWIDIQPVLYKRTLDLDLPQGQSAFLWGPRKTGKSTLLRQQFPGAPRFDLLDTRLLLDLTRSPWGLAEHLNALGEQTLANPVIIDEVQKVPAILDEVHRLIEDRGIGFVLCGSSARKLKRSHSNMLGGRAWRFRLHPLTSLEIPGFDLLQALNRGLIPQHYDTQQYRRALAGYVDDYLKEEVFDEGLVRNTPAFSRFFDALAFSHGELLNFSNIARDCGVDSKTAREYFQILVDTLVGTLLEPFSLRRSREVITRAPKFYLFDVGVAGHLIGRRMERCAGAEFGRALEHLVLMELLAYRSYRACEDPLRFWRTKSGLECDFVLGRAGEVAIEVKASTRLRPSDLRSMRAYVDEHSPRQAIVVCNERHARRTNDRIWILPWQHFLERLWSDAIVG